MSLRHAIENLFRGPSSHGDGLPFADLRQSALQPRESYAAVADQLPRFELGKARWPDYTVDRYDTDAYQKLSLIFRCLCLISHAAGTAKVRVYDEANDDEEIADHPMRRLIRRPNPMSGETIFWGNVAMRAGVAGFCVVEKVRDGFNDVIQLKPLNSSWLKAKNRGGGRFDWEYRIPGVTPVPTLAAEDAIVFRWADTPMGSPYGVPPLATAIREIAIEDKLTQYLAVLLDRGGVPEWMLIPKSLPGQRMDQAEIDRQEERWRRRRGGIERRGFPWIADGFEKPERLSLNPDEMAMEIIRDISTEKICLAFGINPGKIGTILGLKHITENATASVIDGQFYRDTIVPLWSRFDDALTTGLLPDFEPDPESSVSLEFDDSDVDALQEDRNEKARALVVPAFTGGLLSNHMALREIGITVPEGMPEYFLRGISVEAVPADDPLQLTTTTTTTLPPQLPQTTPPPQLAARGPSESYAKRKAIGAANKRLIANVAEAREPSIRRFLSEQAERVATAVEAPLGVALSRSNGHATSTYAVPDMDWAKENAQLRRTVAALHRLAADTAFDAASGQIGTGIDFDLANPRLQDVLDKLGDQIVNITQETRNTVAEIVTAGEQTGKSLAEIADDIRKATAFSEGRSMRIARTESMFSYGEASVLAYKESGVVDRAQIWDNENHTEAYGASDGHTCASRNGIIVPLDDAMSHIYADHPNGSACTSPVLTGED